QLVSLDATRRQQRIEAGAVPFEEVEREARAAGVGRFTTLLADARAAHDAWEAMAAIMDERAGADGPSTTAVRDLLAGVVDVARRFVPAEIVGTAGSTGAEQAAGGETPSGAGGDFNRISALPGQIASREDALRALGEIASFFRRTEPHSPLSYTLDEAVRRGRMTLPDLLAELVADSDARNAILNSLGIRPPPPEATE
ncbi:MAG TPA: type VI secretion system protein TssA, partial [Acetobacteraceae bacterium]|nr:type VI secretion system protein TssA [Acetobacteraceae bacterium]